MKIKIIFLFTLNILYVINILSELRVICTAALINDGYEQRKKEYIHCMRILKNCGIENPYIVESIKGSGPTFLDELSTNVYYSRAQDFGITDIKNKGINEARTMLDAFNYFKFNDNDMIIKITGRYFLKSNYFIELVKNNPEVDAFIRLLHNGTWAVTACYALRYHYFKDMFEKFDFNHMEKNNIYIENKVFEYLQTIRYHKNAKILYVNELRLYANILGAGNYDGINL